MSVQSHILTASRDIRPYASELKSLARSAVAAAQKLLPIKNVDIVFYDNPPATFTEDELGGIGGFTPNAHALFISLNPRHPRFKNSLKNELFFTLIHELHHTVRWQKQVAEDSLLEAMVFEGLADHFAMEVTGRKTPTIYSNALTSTQKKIFLEKASHEWDKPTYEHRAWFFGSTPKEIPRWTGYTLGFDLVTAYLEKHPGCLPSTLVSADASLFV